MVAYFEQMRYELAEPLRYESHSGYRYDHGIARPGISAAVGLALANRLDGIDKKVYLIIGDGESQEGQIWEGAMSAAQFGLNNLIAFTDFNKMQIDGYICDIMNLEDLGAKWESFGWAVQRVDGHDLQMMDKAIAEAQKEQSRPSMIILDTVKGKGAFFAEGKLESPNMNFTYEMAREACERLNNNITFKNK